MDETGFLEVADDLSTGLREADWHSAISRAYYAAFHKGRRLLLHNGFDAPRGEKAHAYVWLRLYNSQHTDVRSCGQKLNELRRIRNEADYDLHIPVSQIEGFDAVRVATDIVQLLHHLATEPAILTRVLDAIKIYERDVLREVTWHS